MIISLLRYILGYVRFQVIGEFPERLFNQLAANGVAVWEMRRSGGSITACIKLRDYMKIRTYRGKNRVRTRVTGRYGLPFFLKKYRLRAGFAAGLVIYAVSLAVLSSFIWNIEVCGNTTLSSKDILSACSELGLYEGARISDLDAELLRTRLALKFEDIAWASVNIEGVKATVNISESIGDKNEAQKPCNLVAARDGIITALEVTEGSIAVKLGQTVAAGELLVSGITEYKDGTSSFGPSSGKVYAETSRTLSCLASFVQTETVYVGDPIKRSVLSVFGLDIPLYFGTLKGNFETDTDVHRIEHNSMYLPVILTQTTFKRTDIRAFEINETEAKALAEKMLTELEMEELKDVEILSKNVTFEVTGKGVRITGEYSCRENIAEQDLLLIYEEK